jgi:hypothetical protein
MPDRAPTPKLESVLNGVAEIETQQLPKILDQLDADELRHLHVLVVEGKHKPRREIPKHVN